MDEQVKIAKALNVAANGRMACVMMFVMCLYLGHPLLAIVAALPVGLSVLVDMLPPSRLLTAGRISIYGIGLALAVALIVINIIG